MVAIAKIADYLGMDMWNVQTKYQSTIKNAIDYLITLDPGQEDPRAALPIVAASLVAYGDDENKTYRKFLEAGGVDDIDDEEEENGGSSREKGGKKGTKKTYQYKKKSWWFYQQLGTLKHSHSSQPSGKDHGGQRSKRRSDDEYIGVDYFYPMPRQDVLGTTPPSASRIDDVEVPIPLGNDNLVVEGVAGVTSGGDNPTFSSTMEHQIRVQDGSQPSSSLEQATTLNLNDEVDYWDFAHISHLSTFHPERPAPFVLTDAVELDEGIYVFWEDIRHLYDHPSKKKRSVWARW